MGPVFGGNAFEPKFRPCDEPKSGHPPHGPSGTEQEIGTKTHTIRQAVSRLGRTYNHVSVLIAKHRPLTGVKRAVCQADSYFPGVTRLGLLVKLAARRQGGVAPPGRAGILNGWLALCLRLI